MATTTKRSARNGAAAKEPARAPVHVEQSYARLQLDEVHASPLNPRKTFDEKALRELADSIALVGVIEPIVVRPRGHEASDLGLEGYWIIAGERRYRAARMVGLSWIPAVIRKDVDSKLHLELALIENLDREDIDPIEEANGYKQLLEMGYSVKTIAEKVNRSTPAVSNALRLLELPFIVREAITLGTLSTSHGVALATYKDFPDACTAIATYVWENHISTKRLEQGVPWGSLEILRQRGVGKVIDYRAAFDTKVCDSCPYNAHRRTEHDGSVCLRPSHYEELQKEALRAKREAEKAAKAAKEKAGKSATPAKQEKPSWQIEREAARVIGAQQRDQLLAKVREREKEWFGGRERPYKLTLVERSVAAPLGPFTSRDVIALCWEKFEAHDGRQKRLGELGIELPDVKTPTWDIPKTWLPILLECSAELLLKAAMVIALEDLAEEFADGTPYGYENQGTWFVGGFRKAKASKGKRQAKQPAEQLEEVEA